MRLAALPTAGEIVLHTLRLDPDADELAAARAVLSADERLRADRFVFEHLRRRFTACHGQLRQILAAVVNQDPAKLVFTVGEHGKPALAGGPAFNVSHSGPHALVAVAADSEVGVDLERIGAAPSPSLLRSVGTAAERAAVAGLPPEDRAAGFTRLWVAKEAVLKASGRGLTAGLQSVSVPAALLLGEPTPPGPNVTFDPASGSKVTFGPPAAAYWLVPVPAPAGYLAALACTAPPRWRAAPCPPR